MSARLVPIVRNFVISHDVFTVGSPDVRDGCITPGPHRLLRFDVLCHNAGDTDIVLGAPASRPDLFAFPRTTAGTTCMTSCTSCWRMPRAPGLPSGASEGSA